jgi:Spy/CpxP family protein refolding chaperone
MINKQNRSKAFLTIIGILLVANIALVSFLLLKKESPRRERPDRKAIIANFLKTEIGFDTLQLKQYDTLSDRHKENMKKMMDSLRSGKEKQFKELAAANFSDSAMNVIANQSTGTQIAMELQMFNHLKRIRLLCTPGQLPKFDSTFGKVLSKRGNEGRKKEEGKVKETKTEK